MTYKKPRHCSAGAFLILEFETHNQLRFYGLSITPHSKNNKKFFLIISSSAHNKHSAHAYAGNVCRAAPAAWGRGPA